jgi:hypothetical protein
MDKHANIHFDGNKFTVTDRHGKPITNTIFNRHRRADALADFLANNFADTNRNTDANFDAIFGAYYDPNGNRDTASYGYAAAY